MSQGLPPPTQCMLRQASNRLTESRHQLNKGLAACQSWMQEPDYESVKTELQRMRTVLNKDFNAVKTMIETAIKQVAQSNVQIRKLQREVESLTEQINADTKAMDDSSDDGNMSALALAVEESSGKKNVSKPVNASSDDGKMSDDKNPALACAVKKMISAEKFFRPNSDSDQMSEQEVMDQIGNPETAVPDTQHLIPETQ